MLSSARRTAWLTRERSSRLLREAPRRPGLPGGPAAYRPGRVRVGKAACPQRQVVGADGGLGQIVLGIRGDLIEGMRDGQPPATSSPRSLSRLDQPAAKPVVAILHPVSQ